MKKFSTKRMVFLGLMAAISIVLTRLLSVTVDPQTLRISLGNVPVILVSLWFGPVEGAVVGFIADFIALLFFQRTVGIHCSHPHR
jgi:ECF transporter S component (folate family)